MWGVVKLHAPLNSGSVSTRYDVNLSDLRTEEGPFGSETNNMALSAAELDALAATDVREPIAADVLVPALSSPPFIPSRSLLNFRDVGAVHGSALPRGRFYRSGVLAAAADDAEALGWIAGNVRQIFDLLRAAERESAPDPDVPGVENVWLDGHEAYPKPDLGDFAVDGGKAAWRKQYMNVVLVYRPVMCALLQHMRDRPTEPILFHCIGSYGLPLMSHVRSCGLVLGCRPAATAPVSSPASSTSPARPRQTQRATTCSRASAPSPPVTSCSSSP